MRTRCPPSVVAYEACCAKFARPSLFLLHVIEDRFALLKLAIKITLSCCGCTPSLLYPHVAISLNVTGMSYYIRICLRSFTYYQSKVRILNGFFFWLTITYRFHSRLSGLSRTIKLFTFV